MSIYINSDTKVICQGLTGSQGSFHTEQAIKYGTKMVGGVTPGKGGGTHLDLPILILWRKQRELPGPMQRNLCTTTLCSRCNIEAIDAEIDLIVCITEVYLF